jgi:hypothetical protein
MRKAKQSPATAYDYRSAIFLVQTLATGRMNLIEALCEKRGVNLQTFSTCYPPHEYISLETLQTLAYQALGEARDRDTD